MINLLSPRAKKEIKKEIISRKLLAVFCFHFLCIVLLLFFFGYLSGFLSGKTKQAQALLAQQQENLTAAKLQDYRQETLGLNNSLAGLDNFWKNRISASPAFQEVFPLLSDDFSLSSIIFRLASKTIAGKVTATTTPILYAQISFNGIAVSREALYELKKNLEEHQEFSDVYFTPNSWSLSKNSLFSFSLNILSKK